MKKQKMVSAFLVLLLAILGFGNSARAISQNNSSADIVVGQSSMTGGSQNGGGSVAANVLNGPWATFYDGSRFFVVDSSNNRVLIYNSIPTSNNASADVVVGQQNMSNHNYNQTGIDVPTANTLNTPTAVFSDGTKLLIADQGNRRVLVYDHIPTTNNAAADHVIGQSDMSGWLVNAGGSVSNKSLNYPRGVFVANGKLFIADSNNNRVLIFNSIPTTNYAPADYVIGQADMGHNTANQGAAAGTNTMNAPTGVFSDGTKLWIADGNNNRVLQYNSIPASNNASASLVIGQATGTGTAANQGGAAGANTLRAPWGIASDGTKLLVADSGNQRVLVYNSFPVSSNVSADSVIGKDSFTDDTLAAAAANTLYDPQGISVSANKLVVADRDYHRVMVYKLRPTLAEVSAPTINTFTPAYTFSSDENGTIAYGGSCASGTTSAVAGNSTVNFNALGAGTYSNCTVTVTNGAGFSSSALSVSPFTLSQYASSNLTLVPSSVAYSKKKSGSRRSTLTVVNFKLFKKVKKNWVTIQVNGKKMKVSSAKNRGTSLQVKFKLVYGKWSRGTYSLSLSYKNQVGKSWERGAFTGDNILTVF